MDKPALERLDSFPYRHRVAEVMQQPLVLAEPAMTLEAAARRMVEAKVSSLVMLDAEGRAAGIVTERDILRALAEHGPGAAGSRVEDYLSTPVHGIRADAFVYRALGRMTARRIRHLVAVDPPTRRAIGMVTGRALLKLRVGDTLQLGDRLDAARNAAEMAAVRGELPGLVRRMLAEGVGAMDAAAVISQVYCDMTRRASELVEAAMRDEGRGPPPAAWAVLVLGSGGRGESLLAPDQDNAIVHAGTEADDPWFEEAGRRISNLLDAAGIPYCRGKVMASNKVWRRSLSGWEVEIRRWLDTPDPELLLMIGIFFDFVPVHGDFALAERLRRIATESASEARLFLRPLAAQIERYRPPLGLLGQFRLTQGRVDLKLGGTLPIVCAARVMALKRASQATSTAARLAALRESGAVTQDDLDAMQETQRMVTRIVLDQQIEDIDAGLVPGGRVDPRRLSRATRKALKQALKILEFLPLIARDMVSDGWR